MNKLFTRALLILAPLVIGSSGSFLVNPNSSWYTELAKPVFNPPSFLFAPVWTILYLLMGIALMIVWESRSAYRKIALYLFGVQLVLNAIWTYLFFGLENPILGLINVIVLWVLIVITMFYFSKVSKKAFWLLVPYILWVSFASVLNASIVILN